MRTSELKGSITVETVFVFPIIFVVILTLMYMSLIMHDKVVLQSVAEEALVRSNQLCHQPSDVLSSSIQYNKLLDTSLLGESEDKHKGELAYYISQELEGKLFICEISNIQIHLQEDYCQIAIEADCKVSLPMVIEYIKDCRQISVSQQRSYHLPESFARKAEVILGTVSQVKGVERITQFLNKVGAFLGKK